MIARHITLHDSSIAILTKINVLIVIKYKAKGEVRKEVGKMYYYILYKENISNNNFASFVFFVPP